MPQDLTALIEAQKDLLSPEAYQKFKESAGTMSPSLKERVAQYLMWAGEQKQLIHNYQKQQSDNIKQGLKELERISKQMDADYKEMFVKAESAESSASEQEADQLLKQI